MRTFHRLLLSRLQRREEPMAQHVSVVRDGCVRDINLPIMPDGNIGAVLTLFSGTGALVKVCTTQRTGYGTYDVPTEDRVLYLSVEKPKDRYNQFVVHELVAYGLTILYFTASLVILPEYKLDLFRATNMENKNSLGLISLCLFLTGMISHSSIPAIDRANSMVYFIAWSHCRTESYPGGFWRTFAAVVSRANSWSARYIWHLLLHSSFHEVCLR